MEKTGTVKKKTASDFFFMCQRSNPHQNPMADEWRERVFQFLLVRRYVRGRGISTSELGVAVPRPRGVQASSYSGGLLQDARFVVSKKQGDSIIWVSLADGAWAEAGVEKKKKRAKTPSSSASVPPKPKPKPPSSSSSFVAPLTCWDIVLGTHRAWAPKVLGSWRWIFTLSCVSKAFALALRPLRTELMRRMALSGDGICKSQANALFGLTPTALRGLKYKSVSLSGMPWRQTMHLMSRETVLGLAARRHGQSFEEINLAFLGRSEKLKRLRAARARRGPTLNVAGKRRREEFFDSDDGNDDYDELY